MRAVDAIVERRVREAREAGYFDDLAGAGKPIPDLDQERPAGWWAERFVKQERHKVLREELLDSIRRARPRLQRLDAGDRASEIALLNERIDGFNRITTVGPIERLSVPRFSGG